MVITSKDNIKVKEWKKLQNKKIRNKFELFLLEGYHLVKEAKNAGLVIYTIETPEKPIYESSILVTEEIIKSLATTITPQKILGVAKFKEPLDIKPNKILALDNLQDPGNIGTMFRLAKAFGFDTVLASNVDIYNPKVLRASQGAFFDLNIIQTKDLASELQKYNQDNYEIFTTMLDKKAQQLNDVVFPKNKLIVVFGNEGQGISKTIKDLNFQSIYIPIAFESLNVACAAAIVLDKIYNPKD